ncbi:MAG TPA: squalene--hopene cyclase [Methylomirabilota bacterium]|jgi:squalene-hopene/tetraprenyl-beta-curcumene cyclase|nr:squalene--hopene cyclase [Methylomirabilota bacterium]
MLQTTVDRAIQRAQDHLLQLQDPSGYWLGELEADTTITAEYLLLRRLLGSSDPALEAKTVRYLRERQRSDGAWNLYESGAGDVSASIKAYFAMKMAGVSPADDALARGRAWILAHGGPVQANVFTKITLALFGQYPWGGVPAMPVEIMLLPRWSYFNLYAISYWSRTVIVPLLVVMDRRPVFPLGAAQGIEELWAHHLHLEDPAYARKGWLSWKNLFVGADGIVKAWEGYGPRPWRARAIRAAHDWLIPRVSVAGGLGGIYPAIANAVLALRLLGYGDDHPLVAGQLKELEALGLEEPERFHLQPCVSPVWDTTLAMNALLASGIPSGHPALVRATEWLLDREITQPGDWQVKRPGLAPGGWPFQFANDFYPDLDDTAMVVMGLAQVEHPDPERVRGAIDRAVRWLLGMQSRNGGWGSFDADNTRLRLNNIPFADHGALLDPPTDDLTARCLECFGRLGYSREHPAIRAGLAFLQRTQRPDGAWYGRWGANYLYGTWSVLRGLEAIGLPAEHPMVERAMAWLERRQNADGGWGESCDSYADATLAGSGPSIPSQTAWALLGLGAGGRGESPVVARGLEYLVRTQRADGGWDDLYWNGTGFPRVFYLKYHLYAHYFPLWALGVWRRRQA